MRKALFTAYLVFIFSISAWASLDKAEELIFAGDTLAAENLCNQCLESYACSQKDKAFYLLGEARLEAREYLSAREAFRSLYRRWPHSLFTSLAVVKIGDSHFLETNYRLAEKVYQFFLKKFPSSEYKNMVYLKLAYTEEKLGNWEKKKYYMNLIKQAGQDKIEYPQVNVLQKRGFKFFIQIGAFLQKENALRLAKKLKAEGFKPQIVEESSLYKVRIGSFKKRSSVDTLAKKLVEKGYPFHIFP